MEEPSIEDVECLSQKVQPRRNLADAFEQNPRVEIERRLEELASGKRDDEALVRDAVRLVVETGASVDEVARHLGLTPSSIHEWRRKYFAFLEAHGGIEDAGHQEPDVQFAPSVQQQFEDNWHSLVEETHATSRDFRQDPLEVFLQTSPSTSWMFKEDGKLERSTLVGVLVGVIGIVAVFLFLMTDRGAPEAESGAELKVETPLRFDQDIVRAGEVVSQFLRADGWIMKSSFLRDSTAVAPLVKDYYRNHSDRPVLDGELRHGMIGNGVVSLHFEVPSLGKTCFFNLVPDGKSYQIDWLSSTLYQGEHFEKFIESKTTTPTVLHCRISRGSYYNFRWADSEKYQCFELDYPSVDRKLFGYAPNDSRFGVELRLMVSLEESHAAVIEVRFPDKPEDDRQVEILRLISKEWIPAGE